MNLRIKAARLNAGLSQLELSEKMQISHQSVNTWELGTRPISLDKLQQMAEILGCTCAYLLGEDIQTTVMHPLDHKVLPIMNGRPVWVNDRGWGLVNVSALQIVFVAGKRSKSELCSEHNSSPLCKDPHIRFDTDPDMYIR